jgi:hypothetical protein
LAEAQERLEQWEKLVAAERLKHRQLESAHMALSTPNSHAESEAALGACAASEQKT